MASSKVFTNVTGAPVADNTNIMTAGPRGPALLQDIWLIEKLAHFNRELIPERRMHAKGSGAHGTFTVTHDITRFTKGQDLRRDRQADADVCPLLDRHRRTRRGRRRA
jgi:catalase